MKTYRNNWESCKLIVNFNQLQWRQDLASFIASKLNWLETRVTRSKAIQSDAMIKEFEIFTIKGDKFNIKYSNKNDIVSTSNDNLVEEYLEKRGIYGKE